MNIAFLAKEYPPYGSNFASALFYPKLAKALVERGHQVNVVSQAMGSREDYVDSDGVQIYRVGPGPKSGSPTVRFAYNLNAWLKLRELAKGYRLDLVDTCVTFAEGFFPSLRKQAPLVLQSFAFSHMFLETNSYDGLAERISLNLSARLEDFSLRHADRIIANSPQTYRYLVKRKAIPRERVILIPEGRIDLTAFRSIPSTIRHRWGIPEEAPLVLFVGWLQARKGIHFLCQAMPQIVAHSPNSVFLLLGRDTNSAPGGGSFKRYIEDKTAVDGTSQNLRLIEEFLAEDELIQLYSACDVFVLPSLYETFGWPVVEAMACGRPVVATATGIAAELDGLSPALVVVPPGDTEALAQAIIKLLSIPREQREKMAALHRRIVEERFSFERMVDSFLGVYEEVVAERR